MKNNTKRTNKTKSRKGSKKRNPLDHGIQIIGGGRNSTFGFPDKIICKMRYHDIEPLASTLGTIAKYVYRLNSTFDPDYTGVGHQPMFRDTYAAIYDHYSVIRTKATIKFVNTTAVAFNVGCIIEDDGSSTTLLDNICEQSHGQHRLLPALNGSLSSSTFTVTWDCKKVLGIDPFASETYKTAVGSNPAEESTLVVWALPIDGSTATLYFDILLEYEVLWTELATPTGS
jgi:hypothetical protein